jgi:hypothetical protein
VSEGIPSISPKAPYVTSLRRVCPWCDTTLGWKDGKGKTGTTYSICDTCAAELLAEWEAELAARAANAA